MKRYIPRLCLSLGLMLLLSGCLLRSVDDLYQVPEAPADYNDLQQKIDALYAKGAENISPLSGERIQNVQLEDLDGDGVQEAIAFFRFSGDDRPLIYIFRQTEDGYEQAAVISGVGTAINTVTYANMDASPSKEVVVSWQLTSSVHSLAVYSLAGEEPEQLLSTDYSQFQLADLDRDNEQELIVFKIDAEGGGLAECYDAGAEGLALASAAPLSRGITGITDAGVTVENLRDSIPAVLVQSYLPSYSENAQITDILAWRDGALANITLDPVSGESEELIRYYNAVGCIDINGDSIVEVPRPMEVRDYKSSGAAANFWLVEWRQYDLDGNTYPVFTTYYNERDGWYLVIPEEWIGFITLSRNDPTGGGERAVIFSYWNGDPEMEPARFLTIYRLTGNNRFMWAGLPGRFILEDGAAADSDVIYAAEFRTAMDGGWNCGLDEAGLKDNFHLIRSGWSVGF